MHRDRSSDRPLMPGSLPDDFSRSPADPRAARAQPRAASITSLWERLEGLAVARALGRPVDAARCREVFERVSRGLLHGEGLFSSLRQGAPPENAVEILEVLRAGSRRASEALLRGYGVGEPWGPAGPGFWLCGVPVRWGTEGRRTLDGGTVQHRRNWPRGA